MATIQIPPAGAAEVIRPNLRARVEIKEAWDDSWELADYLSPIRAQTCLPPTLGQAELLHHYGEIKREDMTSFVETNPAGYRNQYVRIRLETDQPRLSSKAGNEADLRPAFETLWRGFIPEERVEHHGTPASGIASGDQVLQAYELGFLLDRKTLRVGYGSDSGGYKPVAWMPDFNSRGRHGMALAGNRSATKSPDGAYVFSTDEYVWSNLDVLEHLLVHHLPANCPEIAIAGQTELLDGVKVVHRLEGKTLFQAINHLVDRKRGAGWYLRVTEDPAGVADDKLEIYIFSVFGESVSEGSFTIPGNPDKVRVEGLPGDIEASREVVCIGSAAQYDRIVVQGARIKACFTVSPADSTLIKGWGDLSETDYKAQPGADEEAKDTARKTDRYSRVYQSFVIPANWDWLCGDGLGGSKIHIAVPKALLDGSVDTDQQATYWNHYRPLLRHLPIVAPGYLAAGSAEYLPPLVLIQDSGASPAWHQVDRMSDDEVAGEELDNCSVRMLDGEMGLEVKAGKIPHLLALADFDPAACGSDVDPLLDWNKLLATVCCESDERIRVEVKGSAENDWTRELTITIEGAEYWWIAPRTVIGLVDGALQRQETGLAVRDDGEILRAVAAAAKAWYGQERNRMEIVYKRLDGRFALGQYVESVGDEWHEQVGTVLSSKLWDFIARTTTVQTGYWEVDVAGMVDVPGMSDLRAVGREVLRQARAIEEIKGHVGNLPVRDRASSRARPGALGWTLLKKTRYTATPATTSRITMSNTSDLAVGIPLRYKIGGTYYYGAVAAISADAYVDVMGAPLSGDVTELAYGLPCLAIQVEFTVAKASFGATANDLLDSIMKTAFRWRSAAAHLVGFSGKLKTADSTVAPKINVTIDGNAVSTNDSNLGIQPTASWVDNPAVAISTANYALAALSAVAIKCTAAAGTKNAADLTVSCVFVLE